MANLLKKRLSRKTVLRGSGVSLALPLLESMVPLYAKAKPTTPKRMGFVYIPNGIIMENWTPEKTGKDYKLTPSLKPFQSVKEDFQVISGLDHLKAKANGDGAGDHARATATFLTGCQAKKTGGKDIRLGISVDQIAAQKLGHQTRFPSLELSCVKTRMSGVCDSGYSCAYQYNLAWSSSTRPQSPEANPRKVFARLFYDPIQAKGFKSRESAHRLQQSILDSALQDYKRLHRKLGKNDQHKIEEFATSIREIEKRMERSLDASSHLPKGVRIPEETPRKFNEYLDVMYKLMALAWQTDSTRIITFLTAHDGSGRVYPELDIHEGHHQLSHHRLDQEKIEMLKKIDLYHCEAFAKFLQHMKSIEEHGQNLLDSSMIVFGCGISDGNKHRHDDLPVILAGGSSLGIKTGRHLRVESQPMNNLYLSMLDRFGSPTSQFGDSKEPLMDIFV